MNKDKVIGIGMLGGSLFVAAIYVWLLFFPPLKGVDVLVLKLTGAVAVCGVAAIVAWIGYTLATTPPPKPIEEIEKEIEEELKKLEEELKKEKEEQKTSEEVKSGEKGESTSSS